MQSDYGSARISKLNKRLENPHLSDKERAQAQKYLDRLLARCAKHYSDAEMKAKEKAALKEKQLVERNAARLKVEERKARNAKYASRKQPRARSSSAWDRVVLNHIYGGRS